MRLKTGTITKGLLVALPLLVLSPVAVAQDATATDQTTDIETTDTAEPAWPFEESDLPVDPGFVFGRLDNGMRFILRENATPEGTAQIRMRIDSGSLDETDEERGLSHYLEHMAFNGSNGIPEGEMVALLEREGLAFGADTNASTGFEAITYILNLPRNDEDLLDTALMLMRETASELTIAEDAVERERGVILAERRDRRGFQQRNFEDSIAFLAEGARFPERLPIGTLETLEAANAERLRALYERTYTPSNTVLVIVGDFSADLMEIKLRERFEDWSSAPAPADPATGPVDIGRSGLTDIYTDPSLSETVTITGLSAWRDEPDTRASRFQRRLRSLGYQIVNRRLARLARTEEAPFRGASLSTGNLFEDARTTSLTISSEDGKWRPGVRAAVREVNQAITYGFTQAELDEQISRLRTALENRVAGASTRTNSAYTGAALTLVANEIIPTSPEFQLAEFERTIGLITPEAVYEAWLADLAELDDPLIRFTGRAEPEGGSLALRTAFDEGLALPISAPENAGSIEFAYSEFGVPGKVVSDSRDERLGFRFITFANGVRLTLKQTDIREDRISFRMALDGGNLMNTRDDPLNVYLTGSIPAGGLGAHSQDELQTVLAGRSVTLRIANSADVFTFSGATTPRDLDLQLRLLTAALTDPGYRPEGIAQFRRGIDNFFETLNATPGRAYSSAAGAILSDNDPRFSLQPREAFYALDFAQLEAAIGDRFQNGALEIALVGDLDEDAAIAAVAATLGALPTRETEFLPREEARIRNFTSTRGERVLYHEGEEDQALIRMVWPTTDDSNLAEALRLSLLSRVVRIELTERLREELGQAYSPSAGSAPSRIYDDYGTFTISASVEASQVDATRSAIARLLDDLRTQPIDPDLINRARQPLLEGYDNALKSLGGWMGLSARAQSMPDRLGRWFDGPQLLEAIAPEDIQRAAMQYLSPSEAVEFLVLPQPSASAEDTEAE